jgi:diacylglycerol kinase (ATP)
MRYLVIVNPISGRGYAEKVIPDIEAGMREHGLAFDLVRTERPWHAAEIAEEAVREGYDVIATASGDGTANEAINGLMRARADGFNDTAFSILPVGTGNDMAYGLGMRGNLQESIAALASNYRKKIDIGFVKGGDYPEGRYFANGVGIGFDAAVGFVAVQVPYG